MDLTTLDFSFGVVTTLLLGGLAFFEFWSNKRADVRAADVASAKERSDLAAAVAKETVDNATALAKAKFDQLQLALDIQSSLTSLDVVRAIHQKPSSGSAEFEFLKLTYFVEHARIRATNFFDLVPEVRDDVDAAMQRVNDVIGDDNEVKVVQTTANEVYGSKVGSGDRSRYSWEGEGRLPKHDVLQLIARRFIEQHDITSKAQFIEQFGAVVHGVLGDTVNGKKFVPEKYLLEAPPAADKRYYGAFMTMFDDLGAIEFDGDPTRFRIGWNLGYANPLDPGRLAQIPVIEHFAKQGYPILPA